MGDLRTIQLVYRTSQRMDYSKKVYSDTYTLFFFRELLPKFCRGKRLMTLLSIGTMEAKTVRKLAGLWILCKHM